jgi:serine/threonine protein kinase
MTNLIGQSLGRYHILEQLGEGGMAVVYKAYDTKLERDVAIKVIRTDLFGSALIDRILKRFEREAKALARLSHPNIVGIIDYGEHEGSPYFVMEYLPGGTLKQKLHNQKVPWQEAARLLTPIARALAYAHEQGMVHRDVKPSNIMITQSGEPMLTDFGIAKIVDVEGAVELTGTSTTVGTPEYMAPEQVTSKNVDQRADIYALGVVLYEMVTGRKPFVADTPMAVLFKHASEPLPRPRSFQPDLPDSVERILFKALAKHPEDRYENMTLFADALENLSANETVIESSADTKVPSRRKDESLTQLDRARTATQTMPEAAAPVARRYVEPTQTYATTTTKSKLPWLVGMVGVLCLIGVCALAGKLIFDSLQPAATAPFIPPAQTKPPVLYPSPLFTGVPPTQIILPTFPPPLVPTYPLQPTYTPLPTSRPNPTVPPTPYFTASEPMYCREGPSTSYQAPWQLNAGETVPVIGVWFQNSNWILVDINSPDTRTDCCWVSGNGQLNVSLSSLKPISTIPDRMNCSSVR